MPNTEKRLRGETRPSRLNANEPDAPEGAPPMPVGLNTAARSEWDRLVGLMTELRTIRTVDGPVLEAAARAHAEYLAAVEAFGDKPTYRTDQGMLRAHPAVAIASEAWRRHLLALDRLGLTPVSRVKVPAVPAKEKDPFEHWEKGGKVSDLARFRAAR